MIQENQFLLESLNKFVDRFPYSSANCLFMMSEAPQKLHKVMNWNQMAHQIKFRSASYIKVDSYVTQLARGQALTFDSTFWNVKNAAARMRE